MPTQSTRAGEGGGPSRATPRAEHVVSLDELSASYVRVQPLPFVTKLAASKPGAKKKPRTSWSRR